MNKNICYVTVYYDINRKNWTRFGRTFEEYLETFDPYLKLFNKNNCENDILIVFIDKKYENILKSKINENINIKIIPIDNDFMLKLPMWKTIEKEREIMNNQEFKNILGWRQNFPEHVFPEYSLINHSKIDFISWIITNNIMNYDYYSWVDFGFFKRKEHIPNKLMDIDKLNINTINYTLINNIDNSDNNIIYTLQYAPEKIGGFFFFGNKDKILEYQKLYHETLKYFQDNNITDDDQHLALQCYFKNPSLFTLHYLGGWHKSFIHFQKY
jgi:hypothetical protein